MPGQTCAVASCKSNRFTLKKQGVNLTFHRFPISNDSVSSTTRNEWVRCCKRLGNKFNPATSAICSLHFTANDYERDLQNEMLGLPLRRILRKTAVPTLHLDWATHLTVPLASKLRAKRAKQKDCKNKPLPVRTSPSSLDSSLLSNVPSSPTPSATDIPDTTRSSDQSDSSDTYKEKYEDLLRKYNELNSSSNKKINKLNDIVRYYEEICDIQSLNENSIDKYQRH